MLKKAIEIKRMCGLQMFIVLHDTDYNKVFVYNSSADIFDKKYLNGLVDDNECSRKSTSDAKTTFISDEDFHLLKVDKDPQGLKRKQKKNKHKKVKVVEPEQSQQSSSLSKSVTPERLSRKERITEPAHFSLAHKPSTSNVSSSRAPKSSFFLDKGSKSPMQTLDQVVSFDKSSQMFTQLKAKLPTTCAGQKRSRSSRSLESQASKKQIREPEQVTDTASRAAVADSMQL